MDSQSSEIVKAIAILYRQPESILPIQDNSPNELHVATALNLPNFVREIVYRRPELALSLDEHGLTPCHLAVANGYISVIKELLDSTIGVDICRLKDKDGFLPIHIAVMKGRVDVLKVVNDTCRMCMLQELTGQGDSILHLALKFDSLDAFRYLWHYLSGDNKLLNSGDAEGNTLLHLAVVRKQQEIIKMVVDKVDLDVVNLKGSTAVEIFFDMRDEHVDLKLEEIIRRAHGRMSHLTSQPKTTWQSKWLQLGESKTQPSSPELGTDILSNLWRKLFNFKRALSRQAPNDKDRETSNTLMIVATLIASITFQSALNPPGGFIQDGKDKGMAVLERYLGWYLLYNILAFIFSLSAILLTIYIVPKWKVLIKVTKFIVWVSVFFTFMSFHFGIATIFSRIIPHPLIKASLFIGNGIVVVFAFVMFVYSWYLLHKSMSTFLPARSTMGIIGRSKTIVIACFAFLGAALVWLPIIVLDIHLYYMMLLN